MIPQRPKRHDEREHSQDGGHRPGGGDFKFAEPPARSGPEGFRQFRVKPDARHQQQSEPHRQQTDRQPADPAHERGSGIVKHVIQRHGQHGQGGQGGQQGGRQHGQGRLRAQVRGRLFEVGQRGEEDFEEPGGARFPGGRAAHIVFCPQPEDERGQRHEDSRHAERPTVARESRVFQLPENAIKESGIRAQVHLLRGNPRNDEEGEERAQVDGEIENGVGLPHEMTLIGGELIAHERGHARLDAARAERNQAQAEVKAVEFGRNTREQIAGGQHAVADAVEQGNPQNGFVAPPDPIRQPRAHQRQKIINKDEQVDDRRGPVFGLQQGRRDVERQDAAHPVIAEALGRLVADDVLDLRRPAVVGGRGGAPDRGSGGTDDR